MILELRPVPIITRYLRYKLDEYNSNIGSTSMNGDGATADYNIGSNIAMIKSIDVDNNIKQWLLDWDIYWDSNANAILHFDNAPSGTINISYTTGQSWIRYSIRELTADILPIIMLDTTFSPADRPFSIGLYGKNSSRLWLHSIVITITAWFEQDKPYIYNNHTYWGDEFGYYMHDIISKLFISDYDYLLERNIEYSNSYGLMRLMIAPEAEQPPYIARVQNNYVFHFYISQ